MSLCLKKNNNIIFNLEFFMRSRSNRKRCEAQRVAELMCICVFFFGKRSFVNLFIPREFCKYEYWKWVLKDGTCRRLWTCNIIAFQLHGKFFVFLRKNDSKTQGTRKRKAFGQTNCLETRGKQIKENISDRSMRKLYLGRLSKTKTPIWM